jgi:acyl carrier protein
MIYHLNPTYPRVLRVIAQVAGSPLTLTTEIEPATNLRDDLKFDSLHHVTLACELEEEFRVCVPDSAVDRWCSVGDVVRTVDRLVAQRAAA